MTVALYDAEGSPPAPVERTPAYSSFNQLRNLLDTLRENGLPAQFDRSYFGSASGALIAQTRGMLRFLDLIDEEHRPTESLRKLVEADEETRKAMLLALARERYTEEIKLAENSGTHGQLMALFRDRGLTGGTGRKAVTFYLHLAEYVGLPVSPYFTQGRATGSGGATGRRTTRPRRRQLVSTQSADAVEVAIPAATPPETIEAKRAAYVDLLMKLANREGELPPPDLLDRIERALGYDPKGGEKEKTSP